MQKKALYFLLGILVIGAAVFLYTSNKKASQAFVVDFETCAQAGNPVMESYPRQCRTSDGRNFVEVLEEDKSDLIVVDYPKPGESVKSGFVVKGRARGNWFFEASFPINLVVGETVIKTSIAQAQGDWMTTEFVPFEARVDFEYTFGRDSMSALLVLKKDNPSGLPEYDDSISIPVTLVPGIAAPSATCRPSGCSGQVCSDEDIVTTCEFRAEYACYKTAKCERQASGRCGWTQSAALTQCLTNPPPLE